MRREKLLTRFKKLFLFIVTLLLFYACETDDFQKNENEGSSSLRIEESKTSQLNFQDFQNDEGAFSVFNLINGTSVSNSLSRGSYYDESFQLELDTTRIFKIESTYRHSYTFAIINDTLDNGFENLILDYREEIDSYYAYIASYSLNEDQLEQMRNGEVISDFKNYMELNIYEPDYTTYSINNCFNIMFIPAQPCDGKDENGNPVYHVPGDPACTLSGERGPQDAKLVASQVPCEGNGGGGPGGPTAPPGSWDPPSGGGGDGSGNTTTYPGSNPEDPTDDGVDGPVDEFLDGLETVPVKIGIIQEPDEPEIDHLQSLNDLMEETVIKDEIDQMAQDLLVLSNETGVEFTYNENLDIYTPHDVPIQNTGYNYTKFPPATTDSKVRIHMHTNYIFSVGLKTETTPSVQDLFGFADFYKTKKDLGADDSEDITSIVVSRRGLYALRIGDPQKVENFASDIDNPNLEDKGVTYKKALKNLYDKNVLEKTKLMCNNCPDAYEAALFEMNFIEFMKYIPGIKVFRGLNDGNGNYTWEEI